MVTRVGPFSLFFVYPTINWGYVLRVCLEYQDLEELVIYPSDLTHVCNRDAWQCWGGNNYGGLGVGDTYNRGDEASDMGENLPEVRNAVSQCET